MPKLFVVGCYPPPKKIILILPARQSPGAILQLLGLGCMSCTSSNWLCLCRGICGVGWPWTATKPTGNFSKDYLWETLGQIAIWPMYLNTYTPTPTAGQINPIISNYKFESIYTSYTTGIGVSTCRIPNEWRDTMEEFRRDLHFTQLNGSIYCSLLYFSVSTWWYYHANSSNSS